MYGPDTEEHKFANLMIKAHVSGDIGPGDPFGEAYAVVSIRRAIDRIYGVGYAGPIGATSAARIIGFHNDPGVARDPSLGIPAAGAYGVALLVDASNTGKTLPFFLAGASR